MKYFVSCLVICLFACTSMSPHNKPILGKWLVQWKEVPWKSTEEVTFVRRVEISEKKNGAYMEIEIEGHHNCYANGYVTFENKKIYYDSASDLNTNLDSNFDVERPCQITLVENGSKLRVESASQGCESGCGVSASFSGWEFEKQ